MTVKMIFETVVRRKAGNKPEEHHLMLTDEESLLSSLRGAWLLDNVWQIASGIGMLVPTQVHRAGIDDRYVFSTWTRKTIGDGGERFNLFGIRKTN
jgi:hypothetical protein